jgi:hypothetical protein
MQKKKAKRRKPGQKSIDIVKAMQFLNIDGEEAREFLKELRHGDGNKEANPLLLGRGERSKK